MGADCHEASVELPGQATANPECFAAEAPNLALNSSGTAWKETFQDHRQTTCAGLIWYPPAMCPRRNHSNGVTSNDDGCVRQVMRPTENLAPGHTKMARPDARCNKTCVSASLA